MLGRQWNRNRINFIMEVFKHVWVRNLYLTLPVFFVVWSFKIPYMVYELFFTTLLIAAYSDKIKEKLRLSV